MTKADITKAEFDRALDALWHAIKYKYSGKHESLQRAAESWQWPPRTPKQIKQLQSMTLAELWELSQQLEEESK